MRNRRRTYFINKKIQSTFIFGFTLKVVIGFLVSWLFIYYLVDKKLSEALYRSHINVGSTGEIISDILLKVNLFVVPLIILAAVILGELMIKRITGPLKYFKGAMEDFGKGDLTQKKLDNVPELSIRYNAMVNTFSNVFKSIKVQRDELDKMVDKLDVIAGKGTITRQEVEELSKSISLNREHIVKQISFFKV